MKCVSCFETKCFTLKHCEYCTRDYCRKCINPVNHGCLKLKDYLYNLPKRKILKDVNNMNNLCKHF